MIRQNRKRIEHHFQVGDKVEQIMWNKTNLSAQTHGPFRVFATHCNGTLTIQQMPTVTDMQSTRWFTTYKGL